MASLLRQRITCVMTTVLLLLWVARLSVQAGVPGPDTVRRAGPAVYAPGEVLIRFEPSSPIPPRLTPQELQSVKQAVRAEAAAVVSQVGAQIEEVTSFAPTPQFPRGLHILKVKLPPGMTAEEGVRRLRSLPGVVYAEPDYVYVLEAAPENRGPGGKPNDPGFIFQWGLDNASGPDVEAVKAWEREIGDSSVVVAVIDAGIHFNHPDLAANMWTNPGEIPGNNLDDDANGYVDDVYGWDFLNNDGTVYDSGNEHYHGTHVAGIIGAVTDNSLGVAGVAWKVKLMSLKICDSRGLCYTSLAIQALGYAATMTAQYNLRMLTNNSWGGYAYSPPLKEAIEASGMLFVAAAGNDSTDTDLTPHYPSSYDSHNIIAVAATNRFDELAWFSNYGATSVDLAAPGSFIYSTLPTDTYGYLDGTSMAAPFVSGAAALAMAHFPGETWAQIKQRVLDSVDPLASLSGKVLTGGRLNLLTLVNQRPVANAGPDQSVRRRATVQLDGSGSSDPDGDTLDYRWELASKPSGSTATLSSATVVNPTFTADLPGTYVARLVVSDGVVESQPDEVIVTATNTAPVARAGSNQTVRPGSRVQLDGSGSSDPDGDPLTFRWEFVAKPPGSAAALSDPSGKNPTFVADLWGQYKVKLTVNDGAEDSPPDEVIVTANTPPVANAGPDRYAATKAQLVVSGRGSYDPDPVDQVQSYAWRLLEKPAGSQVSIANQAEAAEVSFAPDRPGTYRLELVVKDTTGTPSDPDTVTIRAADVYVAPNPARHRTVFYYDPGQFRGGEIRIYSVAGQLVAKVQLDGSGQAVWALTDLAGQPLASGLYLWVLVDASGKPAMQRPERVVIQR